MKGLLLKDWKLMMTQKKFLGSLLFLTILLFVSTRQGSLAGGYVAVMCTMMALSTLSYDELDNGYAFLFTLPVTRQTYVLEKYLSGILAGSAGTVLAGVISAIASILSEGYCSVPQLLLTMAALWLGCLLFVAVRLPVQLKFGNEKGRIANFVVIILVFSFIEGAAALIGETGTAAAGNFLRHYGGLILALCVVFYVVFLISSCLVSVKIIKKKEF